MSSDTIPSYGISDQVILLVPTELEDFKSLWGRQGSPFPSWKKLFLYYRKYHGKTGTIVKINITEDLLSYNIAFFIRGARIDRVPEKFLRFPWEVSTGELLEYF